MGRAPGLLLVAMALMWAGPAAASKVDVGIGLDLATDLGDKTSAQFGPGPAVRVPVRLDIGQGVSVRGTASVALGWGHDRVEWKHQGGALTVYSDQHYTMLLASRLMVGPEIAVPVSDKVQPYFGPDVGLALVQTFHSFDGGAAVLIDPKQNDADNPNNIDPYASQLATAAGLHAGVSFLALGPFAFDAEAGYTVSFLPDAPLSKSPPLLEATRRGFGLNELRIGAAIRFP